MDGMWMDSNQLVELCNNYITTLSGVWNWMEYAMMCWDKSHPEKRSPFDDKQQQCNVCSGFHYMTRQDMTRQETWHDMTLVDRFLWMNGLIQMDLDVCLI